MKSKKIMSLALAATLMFSMNMTSFAETSKPDQSERPVESVAASVEDLTSITVGTTTASIVKDVNFGKVTEDQIYARATINGGTENELKNETVTISTTPSVTKITCKGKTPDAKNITFSGGEGEFTATGVDLFNNYYDLAIGDTTVRLAAGLPNGDVVVPDSDPLKVSNVELAGISTSFSAVNKANPYYGNDYYEYPDEKWDWASIVYQFSTTEKLPAGTDLSEVSGSMTVASGATVSGDATGSDGDYTFNLSGANPNFTVTNGNYSRTYYVAAEVDDDSIQVTYAINLHEVVADTSSEAYGTKFANSCAGILDGAEGYFNSVNAKNVTKTSESVSAVITVPTGTDAMQPMLDLTAWATSNGYFDDGDTRNNGTYLAELNGLGEFDCGQMSGWMYTTDPAGYSATCTGPNVGAASYTMTNGETVTWYMTTNYFNHF